MEEASFEAKRLAVDHVNDQNKLVRERDKARVMANEENKHKEFVALYEDYIGEPQAFLAHKSSLDKQQLEALNRLQEKKVPAEYIRRYGELRAEVEGELYDFRHRIRGFDEKGLLTLKRWLGLTVETSILLRTTIGYDKLPEYERTTDQINDWLMLCADSMKLEAIEDEISRRLQQRS